MGRLSWYKAEPRAFLDATRGWPFELKAAYRLLLEIIYEHDGRLVDDERYIAGEMGCDLRVWRRLRAELIERGKLFVADGCLRNPKADIVASQALATLQQKVSAGVASGEKRRKSEPKSSYSNGSGGTPAATADETGASTIKSKSKSKKESESLLAAAESETPALTREEAAEAAPPDPLPDLLREVHDRTSVSGVTMPRLEREVAAWVAELGRETVAAILAEALRSARRDVLALASTIVADRSVKLHAAKAAAIHASTAPPRPTAGDLARAMLAEADRASPLAELPHAAGLH